MNKILFGHHGLRGDLAINIPAIEFVSKNHGVIVDMPINKQFADMIPLFLNHPHINSIFITDGYEELTALDHSMISARGYSQVGNPMQPHRDEWYKARHQVSTVLFDYVGKELPQDQLQINLVQWFPVKNLKNSVAFAPFAGFAYNQNNDKMLTIARAQEIVNYLVKKGYHVIQLGGKEEPALHGAEFLITSYFESVQTMLGCKALIHTDTGMGWIASGYKKTQLGLYGHRYYGKENVKNIQPANPNGKYLDAAEVNEISLEDIYKSIDIVLA